MGEFYDEFYLDMFICYTCILACFFAFIRDFKELVVVLIKSKFLIILGIVLYYNFISFFYNVGWVRPVLSESELSQLEISEGIGKIYGTAKADHLYLDNIGRSLYFDFSLCIPYINERKLHDQQLKIWHKGRMVYQLSKNGEIVFSIEKANSNIGLYNLLVVPLSYLIIGLCDFYLCLIFAYFKMKPTKQQV